MQGITYSRSLSTGWKPPLKLRKQSAEQAQELRDRFHIIVEGQHLLPPILDFDDMKFPQPVLRQLAAKGISRPTPIQMQVHLGCSKQSDLPLDTLRLQKSCPTEQGPRHALIARTHPCSCCKPCSSVTGAVTAVICADVAGASLLIASNRPLIRHLLGAVATRPSAEAPCQALSCSNEVLRNAGPAHHLVGEGHDRGGLHREWQDARVHAAHAHDGAAGGSAPAPHQRCGAHPMREACCTVTHSPPAACLSMLRPT